MQKKFNVWVVKSKENKNVAYVTMEKELPRELVIQTIRARYGENNIVRTLNDDDTEQLNEQENY